MKQVPLILWKDVRHLWPQLGVYAALLATFAWVAPQTWPGSAPNDFLAVFVTLLKLLLMASQFVLITSAIQADRLVGEEQFWITRPYDWRSLLGAKFLFVLLCVALPLVLMQWSLLHVAGLNPIAAKIGMASSLLRFALVACIPLMLIASVTESLATAFTFLAALLLAWAGILQFILSGTLSRMSPPFEFPVFGALFGVLLLAILFYQFARRRTAHSRIAIAATLALLLLFKFGYDSQGFGAPVKELIRNHYAIPSTGSLHLVFGPGPVPYEERGKDLQYLRNFIEVKLPIRLQGLPTDARLRYPNVAVTLAMNGVRYATRWENASVSENAIGFPLSKDIFNRVADGNTTMHLELVAEEIRPARLEHVVAADRFPGPMDGNCVLFNGKASCHFAYQARTPTHVEAPARTAACDGQPPAATAGAWLLQVPSGSGFDPVVNETLSLRANLCAGDPLTFTEFGSPQRFRLVLDVSGVKLRDYVARN
jgi:hypothetical protein